VFYEYVRDCAKAGRNAGVGSVMVSNGYIEEQPLRALAPLLTAVKIDLKAFTQDFYTQVCGGKLAPVLATLRRLAEMKVWFEIVVLIVPTLNDRMDDLRRMADWVVSTLSPDVPLHFTRFHPAYKMLNLPPTPPETLLQARALAIKAGCRYVYTGNLPGSEGEQTYCPTCRKQVVSRYGHASVSVAIEKGLCPACKTAIPGIWT
jgi:pyruvate formate lyase activating enzyme